MKTVITDRNIVHVDKDTGEAICESEGVITIKDSRLTDKEKKKQEYLDTHEMSFKKKQTFIKLYTDIVPYLMKYTTSAELIFLINISRFVSWEDCVD